MNIHFTKYLNIHVFKIIYVLCVKNGQHISYKFCVIRKEMEDLCRVNKESLVSRGHVWKFKLVSTLPYSLLQARAVVGIMSALTLLWQSHFLLKRNL